MPSKYSDISYVAREIFSILPHGVGVEPSSSLGRGVIGWRLSITTGMTVREKVLIRQFARANDGLLAHDGPALYTSNTDTDSEMKREAEHKLLHIMAKVHNLLEMWQGSQKATCYTDGISCSKQANDSHRSHF